MVTCRVLPYLRWFEIAGFLVAISPGPVFFQKKHARMIPKPSAASILWFMYGNVTLIYILTRFWIHCSVEVGGSFPKINQKNRP